MRIDKLSNRSKLLMLVIPLLVWACVAQGPGSGALHRWWSGLGPVLPHDTFPSDCRLCHVGDSWNTLKDDFKFDHKARTGVELVGAHKEAQCLRCHNDRGPVQTFRNKGCAGCHEDVHNGNLGTNCTSCHDESGWYPRNAITRHNLTRFPLVGAHLSVSCNRCHPGSFVGNFSPTDHRCENCHQDDLLNTSNPPHLGLGWTQDCHRCHQPTRWTQARIR